VITANNGWLLVLDNLSTIPIWLSDALCRLSTGGGFATRELYRDDRERIFDVRRPAILNGIEELGTRSDLLDRSILLTLPAIPPRKRRGQTELMKAFGDAHPRIFGCLLDALVCALRRVDEIKLPELPRMADFAVWGTAAEPALGWPDGSFMNALQNNRDAAHRLALEASPIAQALIDVAGEGFSGTMTELLKRINADHPDYNRQLGWPKTVKKLSGDLKRLAPDLRKVGVQVDPDRTSKQRLVHIKRDESVTPVTSVTETDASPHPDLIF
jgi:hypothetical protein